MQLGAVGIEGTRVAVEVFVRQKLQAVHEDAGHGHIAMLAGVAHQGEMALVQIAHGGHESRAAATGQCGAQVGDGVNDLHDSNSGGKQKQKPGLTRRAGHCRGSCHS
ncbi:hypothetical protein SDC9_185976 [bioreactor metagenome]|uniref:Uncharacterized protein n=1 Tax=bioreactor metagenome TaxID=1076179 RepID=A0A645HJ73_9ZZZZ